LAHLGGANTYHVFSNLAAQIPVSNTDAALISNIDHLFSSPEGIAFDGAGNLWVANNNDGAQGIQNQRTSLVQITPGLQSAVLATAAGGSPLEPNAGQSGTEYFIYQVPNVADNAVPRPQFGGLQVDRAAGRPGASTSMKRSEVADGGTTSAPSPRSARRRAQMIWRSCQRILETAAWRWSSGRCS
jgi:hypothetical protein